MVLIPLDVLSCAVPMNACVCAPQTLRSLHVNRRLRTPPVFSIRGLAPIWDLFATRGQSNLSISQGALLSFSHSDDQPFEE